MKVKKLAQPAPAKTAKVKFLKSVCLGGGQDAYPGEIYELPKHVATELVSNRLAQYTDEGDPSEHDDAGAEAHQAGYSTVTVEPPTTRDPRPKRKG